MTDFSAPEHIYILGINEDAALVRLPDTSEEVWSLASLPEGVRQGDRVAVRVEGGDLECWIAPEPGLRA